MNPSQDSAKRFVDEAIAITQRLAVITGRPSAPDRPAIIRDGQNIYQDLLRRRPFLVLSPMSEWAVDLLLDGIKTRLGILTESTVVPPRSSVTQVDHWDA